MEIKIVKDKIAKKELKKMAEETFLDMVKAVVDIKKEILAVGGELHADAETELLKLGSTQEALWGINLYPDKPKEQMIEFSSLINIRPRQDNRSMEITSEEIRNKIKAIINNIVE